MAQTARHLKFETFGPDRSRLRNELVALYAEYDRDIQSAVEIMREGEALVRGARAEKKAAAKRMNRLRSMLDDEFPEWNFGQQIDIDSPA